MKIRSGFVSNSSSSSFVISKQYLTEEQAKQLETLYDRLTEDEDSGLYDDNGVYFSNQKNYIGFTGYAGLDPIFDLLTSFGVTKEKMYLGD